MTITRRGALAGALVVGVTGSARAADFPSRPMNWIVPFPPGGSNDIFARPIAAFVGNRLHQPVVVENCGGAGGTIGGMIAARSKPDGCTLLVVNPSLTFAPIVYAELGFDLMRDFAPVSGIAQVPVALVVNPAKVDAKDPAAFLAMARKHRVQSISGRPASAPSRIWPSCCCSSGRHPADDAPYRRRAGAAGPDGRPDRRHLCAPQHRGVLRAVRPPARTGRCGTQARARAARRTDLCAGGRRRLHPSAPGTACLRPRRRRPRSSTCCMPPSRPRSPIRT